MKTRIIFCLLIFEVISWPLYGMRQQKSVSDSLTVSRKVTTISNWTLKTNLLYDFMLMPNLEIELLLSKQWSLSLEGQCAWWSWPDKNYTYQIAYGGPELRYWLKPKVSFSGHYIGIFYNGGLYDLHNEDNGYRGECYLSTGLSYGYVQKLGRRFSLEFGLGAGYMTTKYKKYQPVNGRNVYLSTKHLDFIGPLKVKIALIWNFNKKSNNTR
jgi:hypothetical protein